MDEDWDLDPAPVPRGGPDGDGGKSFSKGRGFSSAADVEPPGSESWYNAAPASGASSNGFGGAPGRSERGGARGRGRGGSRGGRGASDGGSRRDCDERRGASKGGEGDAEPKREVYIPPDPTQDEREMFRAANATGINFTKYDNIEVKTNGENVPGPIATFEESGLRQLVLDNVRKSGYTKPTPIQKHAIPIVRGSRDLMGCAQTGSGKTAAFLLPIIDALLASQRDLPAPDGAAADPSAVIVSPTRELAIQIFEQARKFAHGSALRVAVAYGGTSVGYQRAALARGCDVLVATPGRLNDFAARGLVRFAATRFVVLDEADRMLDMGFLPAVEEVMAHPTMAEAGTRNTLMFSATFPDDVQLLAGRFLADYAFVAVGVVGGACSDVEQAFHRVERFRKRRLLLDVLRSDDAAKTLVFVETRRTADFLATFLSENGLSATSIHGDRAQRERETALREFRSGGRDLLVATGVAARGLDIEDVRHVVNFDLPKFIEEYVHRIGRTGRVGNRGKATSFFDGDADSALAGHLVRVLTQADQPVPDWLESAGRGPRGASHGGPSAFGGEDVRGDGFGDAPPRDPRPVEEPDEEW